MYRQFNIQQFYVLPTQCIYVFCVDLRTNSNYFPVRHQLTGLVYFVYFLLPNESSVLMYYYCGTQSKITEMCQF